MRKLLGFVLIVVFLFPSMMVLGQDETAQPLVGFWEQCEAPEGLPENVSIGAIFGLSEAVSVYGTAQKNAVELAVEEINMSGYLGDGVTLTVIFEDSAGNRDQAIAAMTKLVEEDGVPAVLGPTLSSEAFAADPIAQESGVVVLGVSNTANGITDMGDYVFRDSLPESAVIPGTIAQATEFLGLTKVGVLYGNDDDFTVSGYEVFLAALDENGVEVLGEETFAKGDVDFNAQLTNIINTEPDAIVVSALAAEATQILIQARSLGYNGPIIGGNGFNSPAVLANSGEAAEGLIVGGAWNYGNPEPSESSIAFVEMYEAKYESSPDQFAAQAYTGTWLMATAIRCGGSVESAGIRDALAAITDFDSPLGVFSFDAETREPSHDPIAQLVVEGNFVPLAVAMEGSEAQGGNGINVIEAKTSDRFPEGCQDADFGCMRPGKDGTVILAVTLDTDPMAYANENGFDVFDEVYVISDDGTRYGAESGGLMNSVNFVLFAVPPSASGFTIFFPGQDGIPLEVAE